MEKELNMQNTIFNLQTILILFHVLSLSSKLTLERSKNGAKRKVLKKSILTCKLLLRPFTVSNGSLDRVIHLQAGATTSLQYVSIRMIRRAA